MVLDEARPPLVLIKHSKRPREFRKWGHALQYVHARSLLATQATLSGAPTERLKELAAAAAV
jgi:hypothetical protein